MSDHVLKLLAVTIALLLAYLPGGAVQAKDKKMVRQVVIDEVTRVEGKIQKPEVWYLLPRSNLNFEGLRLESNLVPKIEEATKKNLFLVE
ncbi:MAG TPA: hypothetical protein PK668_19775 [Myxococcota bacterium]|nr:hypothetical protein [Myxococcota bacterium]HRY95027.1 hypothetical protein [Myxococcota bacterium]